MFVLLQRVSARPPRCVPGALTSLGDHQHPVTSKKCHKQPEAEAEQRLSFFFLSWGAGVRRRRVPRGRPGGTAYSGRRVRPSFRC